jgi:hypothetical protein
MELHSRLGMKRVVASLCVCWAAFCGTQSNIVPLNFGMTLEEVSSALGVPLVYYSGRAGSEIYPTDRRAFPASIPSTPRWRCNFARAS